MKNSQQIAGDGLSSDAQSHLCNRCGQKAPRIPLDHPQIERYDRRIQALLDTGLCPILMLDIC